MSVSKWSVGERREYALKLLKEAEFEVIEMQRVPDHGLDLVKLHDAKVGIWNAMERVEALRPASGPSSERIAGPEVDAGRQAAE